jgi:hypothetical protein
LGGRITFCFHLRGDLFGISADSCSRGIAAVGALVCFASILLLHLLPTGYSPTRNAVSDYGVGTYRIWHRIAVLSIASGFALAIVSAGTVKPESDLVIGLLLVFSAALVAIPFFPTDVEGQTLTTKGRIHWALAIVAFGSLAFATGFYKGTSLDDVIGWIVVASACLLIASLIVRRIRKAFPLLERVFYFSMILWFLVTGIELILLAH